MNALGLGVMGIGDIDITDCIPVDGYFQIHAETMSMQYGFQMWPDGSLRENSLYVINLGKRGQLLLALARERLALCIAHLNNPGSTTSTS